MLKNTGSEDLNGLSNKVLKLSMEVLIHPITHLVNQCFKIKSYPNKWKLMKILPLYKSKGDKTEVENFRPIALLSPVSKMLKKKFSSKSTFT